MKCIYFLIISLLISSLSCSVPFQRSRHENFYILEYYSDNSKLLQVVGKDEIYDLTPSGVGGFISGASLSPSEKYIAAGLENGIYIIDVDTSEAIKVTEFGYFPDWSLDEKWLIFRFQENKFTTGSDITKDRVYAVNLESHMIYTPDRLAANGSSTPTWSPTTSSIVFTANTEEDVSTHGRKTGFYSYNIHEQKGNFILESDQYSYTSPHISPDGQFILYTIIEGFDRSLVWSRLASDLNNYKVIKGPDENFGIPLWNKDSNLFILDSFIYDNMGNKVMEIKMDDWFVNQVVWGDSGNYVYIARNKDPVISTIDQLVRYDIETGKTEIVYGTTNAVYLLPSR